MTLPLPPVQADQSVQFALDRIAQQFPVQIQNLGTGIFLQLASTGTARKLGFGLKAVTFTATATVSTTVTHNFGGTPTIVLAGGAVNATAAFDAYTDTPGATTFPLTVAVRGGGSVSTTISIPWIAIG